MTRRTTTRIEADVRLLREPVLAAVRRQALDAETGDPWDAEALTLLEHANYVLVDARVLTYAAIRQAAAQGVAVARARQRIARGDA